jgi:hypothetical protein
MFSWITADPETMWLNVTNAVLGICVLVCVGIVTFAVVRDVMARLRERARERDVFVYDAHSLNVPELGLTMADGGEPISGEKPKRERK